MEPKMEIKLYDREELRRQFNSAVPFRFVKIDNFLDPASAKEVAAAYPSFESAEEHGKTFTAVNERRKIQVTDASVYPAPVAQLNRLLASQEFLADLSHVTGIPNLLADEQLIGGGMHLTGPGGRLDVHVDFNLIEDRKLHRRLNLLLYLNPVWNDSWGGHIQLWDKDVKICRQAFAPALNRCVIFETSEISFHGVVPVSPAAPYPRISFAAYYYTREAPQNWDGKAHSTIFKARPEERLRGLVLMPAAKMQQKFVAGLYKIKQKTKRFVTGAR
jgi:Rps23 Pro-64 3,4-dihydroxylase Tpa1-like proline 4-hydroxylase